MKTFSVIHLLLLVGATIDLIFLATPVFSQDGEKIQELQRVIEAQQKQNEAQQKQIEAQQKQLEAQKQLLQDLQKQMEILVKDADSEEVPVAAEKPTERPAVASTKAQPPGEKVVTSGGGKRVKLALSGQVNRAVNIVDDGKETDAYFVDNDNSESRVRFDGAAKATDDLTLGTRIELTIGPNLAGQVNQNNQETNNIFDQRWTEVSLDSKRFGKLSLGKGATASYGSGAVDLSRTAVISYATISDTAGGMLFRQTSDDDLTNVNIADAFNSFDGLSRRNRVRYDTPSFYGFHLAGSAISDERYDAALFWGGQGYGFKAAGAAAVADPNEDSADLQYNGSFSLLHENTGLNLTLSSGFLDRDNQSDPKNFYAKLGWLTRFFSFGTTAFGVDYTRSLNLPTEDDDGYSIGAAAVQLFEEYGTEVYGLYRLHSLDRDVEPGVHDINVVSIGARVKF
ncbi:MAG: hypothetical protein PVG26_12985 [Desulfobacterales bacterium]|jgi:predicted porin